MMSEDTLSNTSRFSVDAELQFVWDYIVDFTRWATCLPGYESSEKTSPDDFVWTVRAAVGPISRLVTVDVHVVQWSSPTAVDFTLRGRGEPFTGSGRYEAVAVGETTDVRLTLEILPQGPLAKIYKTLGAPVLAHTASEFSQRLRHSIESARSPDAAAPPEAIEVAKPAGILRRLLDALRDLFSRRQDIA